MTNESNNELSQDDTLENAGCSTEDYAPTEPESSIDQTTPSEDIEHSVKSEIEEPQGFTDQIDNEEVDLANSNAEPIGNDTELLKETEKIATKKTRKKRTPKQNSAEHRFLGRRALCKSITDIAPNMLKTIKLRVLGRFLDSTKGLDESALTKSITKNARKISHPKRVLESLNKIDPDVNRRNLRDIIIYGVLLQEETHSLEESRLEEKVIEFEKKLIKKAKNLDFFDPKKHDTVRWHHYDTYRIVLEAAWRNKDDISFDEASLLRVIRNHLNISRVENWLIGTYISRFPKFKRALHSPDEIHNARKELQREAILWSYRDDKNRNIDVIPAEIVQIIRENLANLELQDTNYERVLQHDSFRVSDLRQVLKTNGLDQYGNKVDLVERIVYSDIKPSVLLDELSRERLADMCRVIGLKNSGAKNGLVERIIEFYDDLTFEERKTQDEREEWYNNYELLASRSYADLKAKKLISKDLEIEHQFEKATDFLFDKKLHVKLDQSRKVTKADGRILLDNRDVILWDNKSAENSVNLQDHLEDQFDSYLRKEREKGNNPLAFLVVAPSFTKNSLKLAHQYKARTNWDIALVNADALKYLADQWSSTEPNKPFPIRLLNRTEIIDKERVEFLLSLS